MKDTTTCTHITSHHITSHHITSHHITSHHITSHHITYTTPSNNNIQTQTRIHYSTHLWRPYTLLQRNILTLVHPAASMFENVQEYTMGCSWHLRVYAQGVLFSGLLILVAGTTGMEIHLCKDWWQGCCLGAEMAEQALSFPHQTWWHLHYPLNFMGIGCSSTLTLHLAIVREWSLPPRPSW